MGLSGKVAVVTGATGTIGMSIVASLVEQGVRVAMIDLDQGLLDEAAKRFGGSVLAIASDVTDRVGVKSAHHRVVDELGAVGVLVNNAAILSSKRAESTAAREWRKVLAVNLDGAFYWAQAVLPQMKAVRWGRIINISSLAAKTGGLTAGTAYSTSKGALASLTFSLARESAPFGVTVNAIAPAYVRTPMVTEQLTEAERARMLLQIPVGRFCEPEEVAHAVTFLASGKSGFITGEVLDINGGLQMD